MIKILLIAFITTLLNSAMANSIEIFSQIAPGLTNSAVITQITSNYPHALPPFPENYRDYLTYDTKGIVILGATDIRRGITMQILFEGSVIEGCYRLNMAWTGDKAHPFDTQCLKLSKWNSPVAYQVRYLHE